MSYDGHLVFKHFCSFYNPLSISSPEMSRSVRSKYFSKISQDVRGMCYYYSMHMPICIHITPARICTPLMVSRSLCLASSPIRVDRLDNITFWCQRHHTAFETLITLFDKKQQLTTDLASLYLDLLCPKCHKSHDKSLKPGQLRKAVTFLFWSAETYDT